MNTKKIILKTVFLSIIILFSISLKSFAQSSFRFYCKDGLQLKTGETIDVPIFIDNIKIEGIEKKLFSFSGKLEYDTDVFELVPYSENGENSFMKISPELDDYGIIAKFNSETGVISTSLDANSDYFRGMMNSQIANDDGYADRYLNKIIQVGTIKIKAKENVASGDYDCLITHITGDNGETELKALSLNTTIHVQELDSEKEQSPKENNTGKGKRIITTAEETSKKAILEIVVNSDGTQITITPDEENGAEIGAIKYKNTSLAKNTDKFVLNTEPNMVYELFIYDTSGNCIGNEYVTTVVKVVDKDKKDEQINNNNSDNIKKSPQTGDYIMITIGIMLTMMSITILTTTMLKKQKNN